MSATAFFFIIGVGGILASLVLHWLEIERIASKLDEAENGAD